MDDKSTIPYKPRVLWWTFYDPFDQVGQSQLKAPFSIEKMANICGLGEERYRTGPCADPEGG